MVDGVGC
jgi:RimJ/RimL family protein N-acetyltransferase